MEVLHRQPRVPWWPRQAHCMQRCVMADKEGMQATMNKRSKKSEGHVSKSFMQKTGGGGSKQVLDRVVLQEAQLRKGLVRARSGKRFALSSRVTLKRATPKWNELPAERISLALSCEQAFVDMYTGQCPRAYNANGMLHPEYETAAEFGL
eukprot:1852838-Pleurochrysis_carterae.AAC.1